MSISANAIQLLPLAPARAVAEFVLVRRMGASRVVSVLAFVVGALETCGTIKIVSKGQSGANSKEAAEFRYRLEQSENGAEDDGGFDF